MMPIELEAVEVEQPPTLSDACRTPAGDFRLDRYRMTAGRRAGCELIYVDSGTVQAAICPTRGMSLWKARLDGVDCQWNSPVRGPIHPGWVATDEASGLGWLDGFDELLVRCGLRSFGAPDFDDRGSLRFPLHGRVANLAADSWHCELSADGSRLTVRGEVNETRFLIYNLQLSVEYCFTLGQPAIEIADRVTNRGGQPTQMQLLYHINFGAPLLAADAAASGRRIVARDRAAEGLSGWSEYQPPTVGYAEQVYFSQPEADDEGWAEVLLANAQTGQGVSLRYHTDTLPYFTQWKNTVAQADGYVTGLEPGTGFPNPRQFEAQQGRVVLLQPQESRLFRLKLEGAGNSTRVAQCQRRIDSRSPGSAPQLLEHHPDWCLPW